MIITDAQKILVEKLGVIFEKQGLQPAPARVTSLLTVADIPELSFEEIYETLKISKSAASNAINFLLNVGYIDYITKPGDRKRYFRSSLYKWEESVQAAMKKTTDMVNIFKEILAQRSPKTAASNGSLKEIIEFMEFCEKRMDQVFAEWTNRKK